MVRVRVGISETAALYSLTDSVAAFIWLAKYHMAAAAPIMTAIPTPVRASQVA
jgi:hypothetical protein